MNDITADLPQPVYSRSFGIGPRQVLAVHCSLAHSGTWRGLATALDGDVTLTAFDMLTHGRSPDWNGQGDYQGRNVEAGLSLLHQPVDLMGHSFGATVALQMALRRPEMVRSLTLIEPVFFAAAKADNANALAMLNEQSEPFSKALASGDVVLAARLFNRMWSSGAPGWQELSEATRAAMVRAIQIMPYCDQAIYTDRDGLLAPGGMNSLSMPVLLIRGEETNPVIAEVNAALERRLPNAVSASVAGAGHMVPISHPVDVAVELRQLWLSSVEAASIG